MERNALQLRGQHSPALVEQWRAARREARLPNQVEGIGAGVIGEARRQDCQKFGIGNTQVILGREPVGRVQNIGLAPTDELLSQLGRQFPFRDRGIEFSGRERRAPQRAVLPIEMQRAFYLAVRIETRIERTR